MIKGIHIKNFKSLKDISMNPTSLNLLMGLNGMGKSSLLQSLLLLRQNKNSGLQRIALNGPLVEIGRGCDALYQYASDENISFTLILSIKDKSYNLPCVLSSQSESNVLESAISWSDGVLELHELFNDHFQYLEAERSGPRIDYPMSYADVLEKHQLGAKGEYAIHYLSAFGNTKVPKELCHYKGKSEILLHQVAAWLGEISPDVRLDIQDIPRTDRVLLNYKFANNESLSNGYRPKM